MKLHETADRRAGGIGGGVGTVGEVVGARSSDKGVKDEGVEGENGSGAEGNGRRRSLLAARAGRTRRRGSIRIGATLAG